MFFQPQNAPKPIFGQGSAPDTAEGAYDAPLDSLVGWGGGTPSPSPSTPSSSQSISARRKFLPTPLVLTLILDLMLIFYRHIKLIKRYSWLSSNSPDMHCCVQNIYVKFCKYTQKQNQKKSPMADIYILQYKLQSVNRLISCAVRSQQRYLWKCGNSSAKTSFAE